MDQAHRNMGFLDDGFSEVVSDGTHSWDRLFIRNLPTAFDEEICDIHALQRSVVEGPGIYSLARIGWVVKAKQRLIAFRQRFLEMHLIRHGPLHIRLSYAEPQIADEYILQLDTGVPGRDRHGKRIARRVSLCQLHAPGRVAADNAD